MGYSDSEQRELDLVRQFGRVPDIEGMAREHDRVFSSLSTAFSQGRMTGIEFEKEFLSLWRRYRDSGVPTSDEVDQLFTDVDSFCGDPYLWEEGDLDDKGLREAVRRYLL